MYISTEVVILFRVTLIFKACWSLHIISNVRDGTFIEAWNTRLRLKRLWLWGTFEIHSSVNFGLITECKLRKWLIEASKNVSQTIKSKEILIWYSFTGNYNKKIIKDRIFSHHSSYKRKNPITAFIFKYLLHWITT